jgi:hypothetical protein
MVRWLLVLGLVTAGLASTTGVATAEPAETRPGITIAADLPEPEAAQFVPGTTNVVPATGVSAKSAQVMATTAGGTYTCPGFSTVDDATPLSSVLQDTYSWGGFKPYKVGDGHGNINWKLNPYSNPSWYMWFHSLRWLGQGITAAGRGDTVALERVTTIVHDWVRDNP